MSNRDTGPISGLNPTLQKFIDPLNVGPSIFGSPFQPDPVSTQLADLSYSQWQQAGSMLYPAENQLINYAEDPNYINQQRQQALGDVNQQFAQQTGARSRLLALQGITPTQAQGAAMEKQDALSKAKGQAGAMNQAAGLANATQMGALRGF